MQGLPEADVDLDNDVDTDDMNRFAEYFAYIAPMLTQ